MRLIVIIFLLTVPYLMDAQTQLDVEGSLLTSDPVAQIKVNYPSVLGEETNGLNIDMGLSVFTTGIFMSGKGTGIAVEVSGARYAGRFYSANASGLYGNSHSANASGYGVYGHNSRDGEGIGVYGWAQGEGDNFGVKGLSSSSTGTGVFGSIEALQPIGEAYGVHGLANTEEGAGVFGENSIGPAVFGRSIGEGIGVKGEGDRGIGGFFNSAYDYGLFAEGENNAGGYFIGGIDVNGKESDLVLGAEGEGNEDLDNGVLSSDLYSKSSDIILKANDQVIIKLDDDDDEASIFGVLNGGGDEILKLEETGDLEIKGTLMQMSDRNAKYEIKEVNYPEVLNKLSQLQIFDWKYNGQSKAHMGPMAQDFFKAYHLNESDTAIASVDIDGVALASIKALHKLVIELQAEIQELKKRNK